MSTFFLKHSANAYLVGALGALASDNFPKALANFAAVYTRLTRDREFLSYGKLETIPDHLSCIYYETRSERIRSNAERLIQLFCNLIDYPHEVVRAPLQRP